MSERDLLDQALRPAFWGAVAIAGVAGLAGCGPTAGGFLAGASWNVVNLFLLRALAQCWGREQGRRALALLVVKLLLLYPVGLLLALSQTFSLIGMLLGFSWVFVMLIALAARPVARPVAQSLGTPRD